ncbi:MAG: SLC13 family permease [Planctomycetaceae bacterium]|nr:SLC13 family permease [Planctomycetaceae bacterium]
MDWQAWYTIAILCLTLCLLAWGKTSPAAIMWGAVAALYGAGVLGVKDALGGLSNEGMVTVAVLYIVGAGVTETGAIDFIAQRVLGNPKSPTAAVARLMVPTATISAFINNTPLVAMLIPIVNDWAKKNRVAVSKLMIPLSYASILGGTCSLIGTSTNLVVSGLYKEQFPGQSIGMFDISWVGIPAAIVGVTFVVLASKRLLPDRRPALSHLEDPRQYTIEMLVDGASPLIGKTIEEAGLRHLPGVYLAEIDRDGMVLPAVAPEERLRGNDRLVFVGVVESVVDLQRTRGLKPATDQVFKLNSPRSERCLIEAVVSNTCQLVGQTIRDARFRSNYNAVVLAVARNGQRLTGKIGDIEVTTGDTLLLEAHPSFVNQHRNSRDFFLVSQLQDSHPPRHDKAGIALAILLGMIALAGLEILPMLQAAVLAAALILISRCATVDQAKRGLNSDVLLAIAASFAISKALEDTGAARAIAEAMTSLAAGSPWATLAMVYIGTIIVTEAVTNNAAAALMFPLSIEAASRLGVNHFPFVIAVMMAASNGFATPIGYQTNLMVYGPGGYRFSDYVKIGVPLDILIGIITVALAPFVWPF